MSKKKDDTHLSLVKADKTPPLFKERQRNAKALLSYTDVEAAKEQIKIIAGLDFDGDLGGEVHRLQADLEELDDRYQRSFQTLKDLEKRITYIQRYISISPLLTGENNASIPFQDWELRHKFTLILANTLGLAVLIAGSVNIYTNIMSSSIPVFLDQPWMAWLLSLLLPSGALIPKFLHNKLNSEYQARYAYAMYGLSGLLLLSWSVLFALNFSGTGDISLDWDSAEENSTLSMALVWVQMMSEVAIGASLFVMADSLHSHYSRGSYMENLEYIEVQKSLQEHQATHQLLQSDRKQKRAYLIELQAQREKQINEAVIDFISLYHRYNPSH